MAGAEHVDIRPLIAAVARPGDTVMIGFGRALSDAELDELQQSFQGFTEETGVHVGMIENVTSMIVVRPEEEEYRDAGAG